MKRITDAEYAEYQQYKLDKARDRILTPDGLRFVCEAYGYDALKIGEHFIEVLVERGQ